MCGLLRDLFEDNPDSSEDVVLDKIPSKYLRDIIEYCEHYEFKKVIQIPAPLPSSNLS